MFQNVGGWDRAVRLFVAAVMLGVLVSGRAHGIWAMLSAAIAVAMVLTAMAGTCPLYSWLGISTGHLPKRS